MNWLGRPENMFAVMTLVSSTQAVRVVCGQSRVRLSANASFLFFRDSEQDQISWSAFSKARDILDASVIGDRESGPFYLEFLPASQNRYRLVFRLIGKDKRQVLADAELTALSPALPGVFQAKARLDWDGRELLFPSASSVLHWHTGLAAETVLRFGCSEAASGQRYAFIGGREGNILIPAVQAAAESSPVFSPLSRECPLCAGEPAQGSIRYGRWSVPCGSGTVPLLGFSICQ